MKRFLLTLMLAAPPGALLAEKAADPIKPVIDQVSKKIAELQKAAASQMQPQAPPAKKAVAAKAPSKKSAAPKKKASHIDDTPVKKGPEKEEPEIAKKSMPEERTPPTDGPVKDEITAGPSEGASSSGKSKVEHGPPALIATTDLLDFETLPADRRRLLEGAIAVAHDSPWLPYKFGGSSPADGGFDCSGAMCFVMNKAGLKPPRTSADQYLWLKEHGRLHEVPENVHELGDPSLAALKPGDLLFWSGTYEPTDGRIADITHVAIYLGREKKDKRPVMINATDGRSYRGKQANGYGVYDFYLPKDGSKSKFVGYGTPVGIAEMNPPSAPAEKAVP